jgi:hypothetical protein
MLSSSAPNVEDDACVKKLLESVVSIFGSHNIDFLSYHLTEVMVMVYETRMFVEWIIAIDPVSLTKRIMAVRQQLAIEWETDLDVLVLANQRILESYISFARLERERKGSKLQRSSTVAFERKAVDILNNQTCFAKAEGSPLRNGNFDVGPMTLWKNYRYCCPLRQS